jgi:hypothetical protein
MLLCNILALFARKLADNLLPGMINSSHTESCQFPSRIVAALQMSTSGNQSGAVSKMP